MAKQTINTGTTANDRTGDTLRAAFTKINSNFTELYNGAATGNVTFEANTMIGNGSTDGDFTYGRLSLVPNDSTEGQSFTDYGQYIDIYPTLANDAPHIHIAPGKGAEMTGDLILGDDNYHVDVNHNGNIRIRSYNFDSETAYDWNFTIDGKLNFPNGGVIESVGMGWTGLTNGTSGNPVSLVNTQDSEERSVLTMGGNTGAGYVNITTTSTLGPEPIIKVWQFNGETGALELGGSIQGTVVTNDWIDTTIELDVTATINKLKPKASGGSSQYHLADGIEGQIMYIVPGSGGEVMSGYTSMAFSHARWSNGNGVMNEGTNVTWWLPFHNNNCAVLTLIFVDGAWVLPHNSFD